MSQATFSTEGGRAAEGDVQRLFHQPARTQGEDICIQSSCAETTFGAFPLSSHAENLY